MRISDGSSDGCSSDLPHCGRGHGTPGARTPVLMIFKCCSFRRSAMSFLSFVYDPDTRVARRAFLGQSGLLLSGAAVALMAGRDALAKGKDSGASDVRILNTALGRSEEHTSELQSLMRISYAV